MSESARLRVMTRTAGARRLQSDHLTRSDGQEMHRGRAQLQQQGCEQQCMGPGRSAAVEARYVYMHRGNAGEMQIGLAALFTDCHTGAGLVCCAEYPLWSALRCTLRTWPDACCRKTKGLQQAGCAARYAANESHRGRDESPAQVQSPQHQGSASQLQMWERVATWIAPP